MKEKAENKRLLFHWHSLAKENPKNNNANCEGKYNSFC
jgi:hypothetical protein